MLIASYDGYKLLPEESFKDFRPPAPYIPDSPGHYEDWIRGSKTGEPTTCNFGYAGPLTETVLLGTVAYRMQKKLLWDADELKATNCPEAGKLIAKEYRKGWEL
jgi:hypothetical protein